MLKHWPAIFCALLIMVFMVGDLHGQSEICQQVDEKPTLSLQQIQQADLVHSLILLSGQEPPPAEGKTPEQYYAEEVKMLVDAGYPSILTEVEPDRLVTRRYFGSIMYQIAVLSDKDFASKYGGLTDETQQMNALVEAEWLYAKEGNVYREEVISILCRHPIAFEVAQAIAINPETIIEATLEAPYSPM